ncbi:MAG: hypothetical protein IPF92_21340 [Myxococcales bacterium]|nr:hypothetical protein [Myxococcales bacterium]MBL0197540.1 hypothetical protein [Myxococcales bacterium]
MIALPRTLARAVGLALLAGAVLCAPLARAEEAPISDQARAHFKAGVSLLQDPDGERVEEAYREFKAAYEMSLSPKILGNMGFCAMKLERDGEAIEAYTRYLREVTDLGAEERAQIVRDLQTLSVGVVAVQLTVTGAPAGTKVIVTDVRTPVKGERVTNAYVLPADHKLVVGLRSGHHVLTARAPGFQDEPWEMEALSGSKETRSLTLKPRASAVVAPVPPPTPREPSPAEEPSPSRVPWVIAGAGAAVMAAGAVTGIVALGKESDIASQCPSDLCPATFDLAGARSSAKTFIGVTDVLLIGGGVLVAGGITWALLAPSPKPRERGALGAPALAAACGPTGCSATAKVSF